MYKVKFMPQRIEIDVEKGIDLLEAQIKAGLVPDAPCGGKGTCGKCLVNVISGNVTGVVKACQTKVESDMVVDIMNVPKGHRLLTQGIEREIKIEPMIKSVNVKVNKCIIGDNRSDWQRLKDAIAKTLGIDEDSIPINVALVRNLYHVLEENDYIVNVVMFNNEIIEIRKNDGPVYVMAFDIGTTSVVGYLLDGKTGEEISVSSMLNPQAQFGADVIQRSNYALENGVDELSETIKNALNTLIENNVKKAGISISDVYLLTVVGNTCMHHLFMGITPAALVHAPYNPSISDPIVVSAREHGININPFGKLAVLSNIAGFVGADTVGVLLATGFDEMKPITLAIDIGTNGELVLGNKERAVTCSTAAGPAFEGAKIQCGMRGSEGAIDHIKIVENELEISIIGNTEPKGICGSGLMDIVSILLETGIIDETGRIQDEDELETEIAKANAYRIEIKDGMKVFKLAGDVFLSQKDIREVQLAKGAMAAGIKLMAKHLGIQISEIEQVMIAGAFGNYMSPHSACSIGLIPLELEDKIIPIGNAAGEGAKIAALNGDEFQRAVRIGANVEFLELATDPNFQDCFVDELEFPEYN